MLWVHAENNQGSGKLKLLWSCNLFVVLALRCDAANPFTGDLCPFTVYSRGFFKMKRLWAASKSVSALQKSGKQIFIYS